MIVAGVGVGRDCDDSNMGRVVCVDASPSCADTNLGMGTQLDAMATGVLPGEAFADGTVIGYRIGVVLLLVGAVLVVLLLERVLAVPRNPLAEEVAAEAGEAPEPV